MYRNRFHDNRTHVTCTKMDCMKFVRKLLQQNGPKEVYAKPLAYSANKFWWYPRLQPKKLWARNNYKFIFLIVQTSDKSLKFFHLVIAEILHLSPVPNTFYSSPISVIHRWKHVFYFFIVRHHTCNCLTSLFCIALRLHLTYRTSEPNTPYYDAPATVLYTSTIIKIMKLL